MSRCAPVSSPVARGRSRVRRTAFALLAMLLCASPAPAPPGDWVTVVLQDGREMFGQVLEEEAHRIVINYQVGSVATRMEYGANQIREIRRERTATDEEMDRAIFDRDALPNATDRTSDRERGGYAIVTAKGVIGTDLTSNFFRSILQRGVDNGAEVIIFHLTSPGGYLYVLRSIRDVLDEYSDRISTAFYVNNDCFSAAAMLCMSAPHFFVGPGAAFGAAVVWQESDSGPTAVEAKFASAEAAKWRTYAEKVKRPGILMDAMMIQETEVWADTSTTPWTLSPSRPDAPVGDGKVFLLDSATAVLSLTHADAVDAGAANAAVDKLTDAIPLLDLKNSERIAFNGDEYARTVRRIESQQIRQIEQQIRAAVATFNRLRSASRNPNDPGMSKEQFRREVRRLRGIFETLRKRYIELDYARFYLTVEYGWNLEWLDEYIANLTAIDNALK